MKSAKQNKNDNTDGGNSNIGGIMSGLGSILEKLDELAKSGETMHHTGEFPVGSGKSKGIFGFTVKVGLNDDAPHVESFGNIGADKKTGKAVVQEEREPAVDLFEEDDHLQIILEMPGVGATNIKLEVKDDVLTITAAKGDKKYRKELLLPGVYPREKMKLSCNNGVVEITCKK